MDTNCDPDEVDFVIPGNDDALRAIRLFAARIADAILGGRGMREAAAVEQTEGGEAGDRQRPARRPRPEPAPSPASA